MPVRRQLGAAKSAEGATLPLDLDAHAVTIAELILKYAKFAAMNYSREGKSTHEFSDMQYLPSAIATAVWVHASV